MKNDSGEDNKVIKIKRFPFIMGIFLLIFITAGATTIALTFGNDEADPLAMSSDRNYSEFEKLFSTYDTLTENYYKDVDEAELVNGAIDGMITALDDPYSAYMDEKEAQSFHESISSSFEGIGAEIQEQDAQIMVVSPIKGSPAEKAGIKPNDIILSVNGESIEGETATEAVLKIRGEKGTKVELMISREGAKEPIAVTIVRDTIPIETVYPEMLSNGIGKIQVTSFSENTATELTDAITQLEGEGMKGLILDLRGNPGGLLDQAIEIASLFVPNGEPVLQVENRSGEKVVHKSKNNGVVGMPVTVLIDKGSASASEIVAAAVSEKADIPLIGETSFGKGTVQTAQDFQDGSNVKFTAAKWLTPEGNWIHSKGIKPDIAVSLPEYANLTYISPDKEWKISQSGAEVETAEKMLEAVGYNPGTVDRYFDENTEHAISAFQEDQSLKATGILAGETTTKLMESLRNKILENDTQLLKAEQVINQELQK